MSFRDSMPNSVRPAGFSSARRWSGRMIATASGSVFRTADAFLLEAIYITGYTCIPPHKEIKKTALGAEETVDWKHFTNADEAIVFLKQNGYKVFAVEQAIDVEASGREVQIGAGRQAGDRAAAAQLARRAALEADIAVGRGQADQFTGCLRRRRGLRAGREADGGFAGT